MASDQRSEGGNSRRGQAFPRNQRAWDEALDTIHIPSISLTPTLTPSSGSRSFASRYLSPAHAYEFANTALFAEWSGTWLNALATLTWTKCTGFDATDPGSAQAHIEKAVDCVRELLRRRRVPLIYAWVKEEAPTARCGVHHHLLCHLPLLGYDELLWEVRDRLGERFQFSPAGLDVKGSREPKGHRPGLPAYSSRQEASRQIIYFLKNLDPAAGVLHRGRRVPFRDLIRFDELAKRFNVRIGRPTAVTPGKMSASAACLGPKARKQAGWREVATPEALVEAIELGYSPANDASPPPAPERRSRLIAWYHALDARTAL